MTKEKNCQIVSFMNYNIFHLVKSNFVLFMRKLLLPHQHNVTTDIQGDITA